MLAMPASWAQTRAIAQAPSSEGPVLPYVLCCYGLEILDIFEQGSSCLYFPDSGRCYGESTMRRELGRCVVGGGKNSH